MSTKNIFPGLKGLGKLWNKQKKPNFGNYSLVQPGIVSPMRVVPSDVPKPSYHTTGVPTQAPDIPEIKSIEQVKKLRNSGRLAADILRKVGDIIKVGMTTDEIDVYVHELCIDNKAYPSPLNYKKFPKSICTSVNNVACHGIPDDRPLENGDIINVDITVFLDGYHGDCSKTFLIGDVDEKGKNLVSATEYCLNEAIQLCRPGTPFRYLGTLIEDNAQKMGFNVVPCFIGHGIGSYFHGPPDIYHFTNDEPGTMRSGMTFTIEPVLTQGGPEIEILEDQWTAVAVDHARTAQFEHSVLVTKAGCEILTLPS